MQTHPGPYAWVASELAGTPFASIAYVEETGSTNADAAALLSDERARGHTIVAEFQRTGFGRKARSWMALPGTALLFTTILPRAIAAQRLWIVPFWVALAVRGALAERGVRALLQWPNDLLLAEGKLAGILCQSRVTGSDASVACGVGINIVRLPGAAAGIEPPPAFCDDAAPVERSALLRSILTAYDATLATLDDPQRVAAAWERAADLPGRRYTIRRDGEPQPFEATAQRLADGGGLEVVRDDGAAETVALADARVLR
ncbi:MAG: biotin--[acetyl-CoA-carboxylase] ligase [Candidatus Baltobacteraceae bacterium]